MNRTRTTIISLLFAALFVVSQGLLLVHESDLDGHIEGDNCELCLQFGKLGSALLGEEINLDFPPLEQLAAPLQSHSLYTKQNRLSPPSRAPPFFI